jgi:NitT/TauT family transport system permease protein
MKPDEGNVLGLVAQETRPDAVPAWPANKNRQWFRWIYQGSIYVIVVLGVWQAAVSFFRIPSYLVPAPAAVFGSLWRMPDYYLRNAAVTLVEAFGGALLGFFAGALTGILLRYGGRIGRAVSPLILASQVFPKEALAPLFLVYLGFGIFPKIVIAALICYFPVTINTLKGLQAAPRSYERLMDVLGASEWRRFWHCRVPFAIPYLLAALRLCTTLSVIGAVVGEFVGSSAGLGRVIRAANSDIGTDRIYVALLLLGVLGMAFYGASVALERFVFRRFSYTSLT